jgi:eukaryotic-like serine/threonine-protein kinase
VALSPGTRVGPYEVTAPLGAGGMGEVCRARDTKLQRDVALKVLPVAFATDPERMTRFQREAQLLAALNHPNIAGIYGLEDGGGCQAIVMELVEGQTLTGPLPIADTLRIAKQIAEAIEYAHDRGIIHRDLKPANIKVTPDGSVKILDFGLAKAMDEAADSSLNLRGSMSPTLSLAATHAGVIMGTAGYMAPEQAKGKGADRRSDVWSFGIVLYELITGSRMFDGDTVPETLASVMKDQVTLDKLPEDTPSAIRKLLGRCLDRDPRRRLQSIGEARIVIEDVIAGVTADESRPAPVLPRTQVPKWPFAVAALGILSAAVALGWALSRPAPPLPAVNRFTLSPPDNVVLSITSPNATQQAVSPDGRYVAFVADEPGRARTLWVRALDSLTAQRLDRTEGADMPFWSPDSQHIGYFADSKLMRISVAGGAPLKICDAQDPEGGTWFQTEGQDGVIIFAPDAAGPLQRVLAQGGVPTPVTKLADGETAHSFPQFLPDGRRFLFLAEGTKPGIHVQSLDTGERTFVTNSIGRAAFAPPGILLYLRDATLLAHRWNLQTLKLEGEPVSIAEDVRSGGANGRNAFAVSTSGVLVYRAGGTGGRTQINWYSRDGKRESGPALEAGEHGEIDLSSDDRYLVVVSGVGDDRDLWLKDFMTGVFSRLTLAPGAEVNPVWSPDSRRVAYVGVSPRNTLFETAVGSGKYTEIPAGASSLLEDWTDDGKYLVTRAERKVRLLTAPQPESPPKGDDKPQTILEVAFGVDQIRVSPDGRWVAYTSFESGQQPEVYVAAFPSFTDRRQISSGSGPGAVQALWRRDGRELFFLGRDRKLMALDVESGATLRTGQARQLFESAVNSSSQVHMYAVTRDGKRFLVREPLGSEQTAIEPLYIVTNWTSLVRN